LQDPSEVVKIRAFRGGRRSSVYREHVVSEKVFVRILGAAEQHGQPVLSSLDQYGAHELDKSKAREIAKELRRLRERSELPDLDDDLTAFAEVARWCARASGNAWLRIEGR
jgi:hypothetical protein